MLELTYPKNCDNAPRKTVLRDFNVAFANGDVAAILSFVHDSRPYSLGKRAPELS